MGYSININKQFINIKTIFIVLLFLTFIKPVYFSQFKIINETYSILMLISGSITFILFLKEIRLRSYTLLFVFYQLACLVSTYLNHSQIGDTMPLILKNIAACILIDYLTRNNSRQMLRGLGLVLGTLAVINLILFIIYPEGMLLNVWGERINFLEADNKITPILLTTITVIILDSLFNSNNISSFAFIIVGICMVTVILMWPASGILAIVAFIINMVFIYNGRFGNKINIWHFIGFFLASYLIVVILRLQNYFSFLIVDILNKDITLSNRIYLWDDAIALIKNASPMQLLIGHGYDVRMISMKMWGVVYQTHSHNEIFETILQTGLLGLVFVIAIIVMTANKLFRYREYKMTKIITFALFSFFLMSLVERCFFTPFYMLLMLSNNIDRIINQNIEYQNKKTKIS